VELSEIENVINSFKDIKTNSTISIENSNQKTITSFIVANNSTKNGDFEIQKNIDIDGFLNDPIARVEFKLSQKGNRKLTDEKIISLKNKNTKITLPLSYPKELKDISSLENNLSLNSLSTLLNTFSSTKVDNNPLPKYFYPSAGSLYPIQIFLYIPENISKNITQGYYYYDRINHSLALISQNKSDKKYIECFFVGKIDAIKPMYGPASKGFCSIEIGHIYQLFLSTAQTLFIGVVNNIIDNDIKNILGIDENYIIGKVCQIGTLKQNKKQKTFDLSMFERQSFRTFQNSTIGKKSFEIFLKNSMDIFNSYNSELKIYLYIKKIESYLEGFYHYSEKKLIKISNNSIPPSLYQDGNKTIYNTSSFSIFFVSDVIEGYKKSQNSAMTLDDIDDNILIEVGFYGQILMNYSTKSGIGLCPIGFIDSKLIKDFLKIKTKQRVIYSFLGGAISEKQTTYWGAIEEDKNENLEESLRNYLKQRIPEYMIPSSLIFLNELPITPNGKIDKKNLLNLAKQIKPTNKFIAPRDEIEQKLADIFKEVLELKGDKKIGIYDNFFELGGHSLLAIQIISKLKKIGITITLRDIFTLKNINSIAKVVKKVVKTIDIKPLKPSQYYEVSNAQKRIWVVAKMQSDNSIFNTPTSHIIEGKIDYQKLNYALNRIIEKYELFRTIFKEHNGDVVCEIIPKYEYKINLIDCKNRGEEYIKKYISKIAFDSFDLSKLPLMELFLFKLNENKSIFYMNIHHILIDRTAGKLFMELLASTYNSNKELKKLPFQYKDYAFWQNREILKLNHQKEYWLNKLKHPLPILDFPTDFIRPTIQTSSGKNIHFSIEGEILKNMDKFTIKKGITLFSTLLAILKVLIYKYSGQNDVIIGTAISQRDSVELEKQLGLFINMLAFRDEIDDNINFEKFLNQVHNTTKEAFENKEYPFDILVEDLKLEKNMSHSPVFDIAMALTYKEKQEKIQKNLTGLSIKDFEYGKATSKYDMLFIFEKDDNSLNCELNFNSDIYNIDTMQRVIKSFKVIFNSILQSNKLIKDIEVLQNEEREKILKFSNIDLKVQKSDTIDKIFTDIVSKNGNKISIIYRDKRLSYEELNKESNHISSFLQNSNQEVIGLFLEKSEKSTISMLGILKSGNIYMPLDTTLPLDRVEFMIKNANCKRVLSDNKNGEKLKNLEDITIIDIAKINPTKKYFKKEINPNDLAYIIYTSGTTGKPKGVMVSHSSFTSMMIAQNEELGVTNQDSILQFASISFDASVYESFMSILSGAKLVILDRELINSPKEFREYIKLNQITKATVPPSFLHSIDTETFSNLDTIITAGESPIMKDVKRFGKYLRYINAYGPTEASVCSSTYEVDFINPKIPTPIGKPLKNNSLLILNKNLQIIPIGVKGDIYIGGNTLAKGYINRDDLTKKAFIPNPYKKSQKIYKTGDVGYWLESGDVVYLGRSDNQVKIRGFRIELSEIEINIKNFQNITNSIVIYKDKLLLAYFMATEKIDINSLKNYLIEKLPNYMIPINFMQLEKFPINNSGKIDKKALPEISTKAKKQKIISNSNKTLEILLNVFKKILNIDTLNIDDDYFMLGGDSIKAIQIISALQPHNIKLEVKDIFELRTIEKILPTITKGEECNFIKNTQLITGRVLFSPIQKWFFEDYQNKKNYFNMNVLLKSSIRLEIDKLKSVFEKIISKHDMLRAVLIDEALFIPDMVNLNFSVIDLRGEKNQIKSLKIKSQSIQESFKLNKSMFNITLFKLDIGDRLLISIHHLIFDTVSFRILMQDLNSLYENPNINFETDKNSSFKEWITYLYSIANSKKILEEVNYWKNIFSKTGFIKKDKNSDKIENVNSIVEFSQQQTKTLLNVSHKFSIQEILLAGLTQTLYKTTNKKRFVILKESHGRINLDSGIDLNNLIGWLTTMFPLALNYKNDLKAQLHLIKKTLSNIPNGGIGFGILKYLSSQNLKFKKIPQINFNYLGEFDNVENENIFEYATENSGNWKPKNNKTYTDIEINAQINSKKLSISISFNKEEYNQKRVKKILNIYKNMVITMGDLLSGLDSSDIDYQGFDNKSLEDFLSNLEGE